MSYSYVSPSDQRLIAAIANLQEEVRSLRQGPFRFPVLEEDPAVDSGTNAWVLHDGRLRIRLKDDSIVEYARSDHSHPSITGTPQGGSTSTVSEPPPPYVPTSKVYSNKADWTQSYNKGGAQQRSTADLYYGNSGDSYNKQQKSMIHFPSLSVLAPGPAGTSIKAVYFTLYNEHTWYNNGADLRIGLHNASAKPGSFSETVYVATIRVGKSSHTTYKLPNWVGERMRDGTAQGITLNQNSDNRARYGYASGIGGGTVPSLRIEYTK